VKPIGWKFDLLAGPAVLLTQGDETKNFISAAGLGGAFDAGVGYGFAPNFGIGLRGGGIISQWPVQMFYVGPGFFMPSWHWGMYITAGNVGSPDGHGREWGCHIELPYEFDLSRLFKIDLAVGLGFYRDVTEETIRLEFGI
jgi:hypothetical protein